MRVVGEPRPKIVQVSDISIGFGNGDALSLIGSLRDHYGLPAAIVEPDQPEKPVREEAQGIPLKRIPSAIHLRSAAGRVEYIRQAAELINAISPSVLVIRCSWTVPVLLKLKRKPQLVLYHCVESVAHYGAADLLFNRLAAPMIDIVVFPEENRAAIDAERCEFRRIPIAIAYNCPVRLAEAQTLVAEPIRNGKILYAGALDRDANCLDHFLDPRLDSLPIDLYGHVGGADAAQTRLRLQSLRGNVSYMGYWPTEKLAAVRPYYAFSSVMWNPSNENQLYACPHKFFESIASFVPPICAPHPQCKTLIERYRCGIVMRDWSFGAFQEALAEAKGKFRTADYESMVEGCRTAVLEELNWDRQFARVRPLLPSLNV